MIGVKYLEDKLILFDYDSCAVYNNNENIELIAVYELTPDTDDVTPYEKYDDVIRENPKKRGGYIYYKSDKIKGPPTIRLGKKHQSNYLVRVDNTGNRTVLLNRVRYRITWVSVAILIIVIVILGNLIWIEDKYHYFYKLRKKRRNNKQMRM